MQFSKTHKKSSAQFQKAKAARAKWDRPGTAKTAKPLPTKCANSTKKENAGMAKSAEMNIPNSAKSLLNMGVWSSALKDATANVVSPTLMHAETRLGPKSATEKIADSTTSKKQMQENQESRPEKP